MNTVFRSAAALAVCVLAAGVVQAAEPRVVAIAGNDAMQYSVKRIEVKAGESIKIALSASGSMPKAEMAHNWVLLAKGTDPMQFAMAAAMARDTGYIPAAKKSAILAMTPGLIGAGEKSEVVFTAPKEPGEYTYVCTFPGHFIGGMKGVLIVK
ncbi:MAG: plastocyanin/azurin family copper-binding protein [Thermoanaerobaculia bacterium]